MNTSRKFLPIFTCSACRLAAALMLAAMGLHSKAGAQVIKWDNGGGDSLWATATNWSNDTVPTAATTLTLDNTYVGTNQTISLGNTNRVVGTLTFSSALNYIFNNGTNRLQISTAGTNFTQSGSGSVTFNSAIYLTNGLILAGSGAGTVTFNGNFSDNGGTDSLTMNGSYTIILNGTNNTQDGTVINSGTVEFGSDAASSNGLTLNGGTIRAGGGARSLTNAITVGGNFTVGGSNNLTLSGAMGLGAATRTVTVDNTGTTTFSGVLSNGGLTKAGSGTLLLSAANTYASATTLSAGTLRATTNAGALGAGTLSLGGGKLSLANDTGLAFNRGTTVTGNTTIESDALTSSHAGVTHTLGTLAIGGQQLSITAGSNVSSGTAGVTFGATTLSGNATFDRATGTSLTLGALNDGGSARTVTFQNSGSTTLATAAGGLVTGTAINVTGGRLNSNQATALGTLANVTLSNSATLAIGATGQTFGALNGASTNSVSLGANSLTVGNATNNLSSNYAGTITGGGTLTKAGSGTLTLSGATNFSGTVIVSAGTLVAQAASVFNSSTQITVSTGAILNLSDFNATIGSISSAGTLNLGAGTGDTLTLSAGSSSLSGTLSGAGTIIINSGASLTLNASFSNSSINFILNGGTLNLNGTAGAVTDTFGTITLAAGTASALDFGSSTATTLNTNSIVFGSTSATLSATNWANGVDYFNTLNQNASLPSGTRGAHPEDQITFTGPVNYSNSSTGWQSYDSQITPVPEPSTYGACFVALTLGAAGVRRYRNRKVRPGVTS